MKGESAIVKYRWILLGAVTAAGLFLDLGTKYLAYTRLEEHVPVEVIGRYLMWKLVYNDGAVFGTNIAALLPWLPPAVFFVTFMLLAIGFLLFYFKMLKKDEVLLHIGMMLVMPGALGNLHDRIAYGDKGVVDFILMGIPPNHYWFIYNVADIFVTVGVSIMVIYFIVESFKKQVKGDDGQQEVQAKEGAQD
ncbi:MAG: signal peptidase II [Chitinispirillia bacterium]|nr:signal peptidase II [Chitinispirillia bacterium]